MAWLLIPVPFESMTDQSKEKILTKLAYSEKIIMNVSFIFNEGSIRHLLEGWFLEQTKNIL